ncbi:hypothetical protein ACTFSJ_27590 [Bacillus cereus group sp. MYBK12-2]|uniref:hypothetical protein n=1 Tax=Bacillus cereus group sp. MYBK12-2 TaxID=3450689 RepID=UPI0032F7E50B|nr:hypothetical protein [Bacillus pacificus]HDR7653560.1 hypothetical protein [Bacillus pacificus]
MPVLKLKCQYCQFRFEIGYISHAMDVSYCPNCGESFLEYWPERDGEKYEYREKNWFFHYKPTGDVWSIQIQEDQSKKVFAVDIQGPESDREAFEVVTDFLKKKKFYIPSTVIDMRVIGVSTEKYK